jgi:hypothetical protein
MSARVAPPVTVWKAPDGRFALVRVYPGGKVAPASAISYTKRRDAVKAAHACNCIENAVALHDLLKEAYGHLEYCGWGDSWERECVQATKLPERIEEMLKRLAPPPTLRPKFTPELTETLRNIGGEL